MATVRKRSWITPAGERHEAWRVRYVDSGGQTRTRQFALKRDADAFRIKAEGEVAAGIHTADRASVTVLQAANSWLEAVEKLDRERGTLKAYREIRDRHIAPLIGHVKLSRLSARDVVEFRDSLISTRSAAMARKAVRTLSMILNRAMESGKVAQNVARSVRVDLPKRDRRNRVVIPTRGELVAMMAAADRMGEAAPMLGPLMRVAVFTGLRSSELRALAWSSVDLVGQTLTVDQLADRWNDIGAPKSAAGRRTIPIGPALVADLKRWKLRCPLSPLGLVFPNESANPLSQHRVIDLFLAVQIEAGIAKPAGQDSDGNPIWKPRYGLHSLRHAAASAWIRQGIDLKRLQVWIGHATIALTLDTYGHLITDAQADAALASQAEAALLA